MNGRMLAKFACLAEDFPAVLTLMLSLGVRSPFVFIQCRWVAMNRPAHVAFTLLS